MVLAVQIWGQKSRFKRIFGNGASKSTFYSGACLASDPPPLYRTEEENSAITNAIPWKWEDGLE